MYLEKIKIKNFRLFEEFELTFNPGLNVLVGENNSGKTALIDAIRYTIDTNSAEWIRISREDFLTGKTNFSIQLKFDGITHDQASVFVEHLTHEQIEGGRKSVLYVNLIANLTDDHIRGRPFIGTNLCSGEYQDGPRIEREIRTYLSATYLKPLRDADAELAAGRGSRLSQILSTAKEMNKEANLQSLLETVIKASREIKKNEGIETSRGEIQTHFENLTFEGDKDQFSLAIQILGSKAFEDLSETEKAQAFLGILERLSLTLDETKPLQGLGYNNVLFMATELLLLEEEVGQFPLLLIEEPEAHLHPQLQMKFLKFIRDVFSQTDKPTLQTILTTHSPNLASKAPLDSVIVMKDASAFALREGETDLEKKDYVFLEKFLDVTKSNLFFAKGIIIVEGDAENILLPTIAELLGRPLEDYGISIVNVGNTAYMRYANIFKRKGKDEKPEEWLQTKVSCFRDLDLWPQKADRDRFPNIGFKELKDSNKHFWEKYEDEEGNTIGRDPIEKKTELQEYDSQNVKVFVSDKWTFEYCLANGLAKEVFEAAVESTDNYDGLQNDPEEKAIQIYRIIEEGKIKTRTAYNLVNILRRDFGGIGNKEKLKEALPEYIRDTLEYMTGEWPPNLDEVEEPQGANEREDETQSESPSSSIPEETPSD